jgi:hypothetical protein
VTPDALIFAEASADFLDEVSSLGVVLSIALNQMDIVTATEASIDLWLAFKDAPEIPNVGLPFEAEWRAMIEHGEVTYDVLSDALIEVDVDKMNRSTENLNALNLLTQAFTERLTAASDELEAYMDA